MLLVLIRSASKGKDQQVGLILCNFPKFGILYGQLLVVGITFHKYASVNFKVHVSL